jgi:hypothetical protein
MRILPCAALLAGIAFTIVNAGTASGQSGPTAQTNPGFNPATGQINSAVPRPQPPSVPERPVPTQDEARAALTSQGPTDFGLASGPIGATTQTLPAKQSTRNDTLDRVPIMAWPLALSEEQRRRIYQTVMADVAAGAADAASLGPSAHLSAHQALDEMHPLPQSLDDIAGIKSLEYLKTSGKVLLVEPATRTVVAQLAEEASENHRQ